MSVLVLWQDILGFDPLSEVKPRSVFVDDSGYPPVLVTRALKGWLNSNQKQRWLAAALLDIEARLRRLRGYHSLPQLRRLLRKRAIE